jgi:cysteine desulfuration protein SufE
MPLPIAQRIQQVTTEFEKLDDWEDRYKMLIQKGKDLESMPVEFKNDKNLVKGCQSKAWLHAEWTGEGIKFFGDSEASIVKGVIALLLFVYSEATPDEILATKPEFLGDIGLREHLSMSRANGLSSMVKQLSMYALVFKAQHSN